MTLTTVVGSVVGLSGSMIASTIASLADAAGEVPYRMAESTLDAAALGVLFVVGIGVAALAWWTASTA